MASARGPQSDSSASTKSASTGVDGTKASGPADEKLTLERLYPEKSFFGPSARGMAFSRDGRFAAFLYQPYLERRHGADLYVYDTKTQTARRLTSVSRLAEYDAEVRKVRDDREKTARADGVTLASLAADERERNGWTDGWPLGAWSGTAALDAATPNVLALGGPSTDARLTLKEGKSGAIEGELRLGLVRLPVAGGTYDAATKELKAKVADPALKVDGTLTLSLAANDYKGTASLKLAGNDAAQTLQLTLTRAPKESKDGDADPKTRTPVGVVGAIGERLTLGDVVNEKDATINDKLEEEAREGSRRDGPKKEPAPRYAGVSSFEWLPAHPGVDTSKEDAAAAEMLLVVDGDVYRLVIDVAKWDAPVLPPAVESTPAPESTPTTDALATPSGEVATTSSDAGAAKTEGATSTDAASAQSEKDESKTDEPKTDESKSDDAKKKPDAAKREESKPIVPYRGDLTRLTHTRTRETDVQYLPDGSGYTYLRDGALLRVSFGSHEIVQLDPELKDGERMVGYRLSPDQKRLVFLASRGGGGPGSASGRAVTIVNYRDRFARAIEVPRHMPDDPWPESYSSVYLYDLGKHTNEDGQLERVFTKRVTGPRDVIRVPEWSPDSTRVAFAAFEQSTGQVRILESGFAAPKDKDPKKTDDDAAKKGDGSSDAKGVKDSTESKDSKDSKDGATEKKTDGDAKASASADGDGDAKKKEPEFTIENAKVVYQFFHNGGPNTPGMIAPLYLPDSRRLVFITELSGYRQLHLLDPRYEELTQLTSGKFEVYPFQQSADHRTLFYTSTEGDSAQDHIYAIDLDSKAISRLTKEQGVYSRPALRDDGSYVLAMYSDFGSVPELVAISEPRGDAKAIVRLTDSHPYEAHALTRVSPEYFTFENRHGQTIHGHMFKPKDWKAEDKRPLLVYVYGGPLGERNMLSRGSFDGSGYFFARYMAENHGYVTATIDPRGMSGYGAVFEKANFEQVGKPQTEDLVDGARWLAKNAGVDEKRMALHGWSFGGFQTQMVLYTEPDVFAAGIAGAGPTEWHNYNSWYSTGTVGANQPGKVDLEKYSLLPLAKNLKNKLLLVHGMEDSNVLYQDTVRVYRELLKAKKQNLVELFVDPTGGHGLGGDVKSFGRFSKYEDFLLRTVGTGITPATPTAKPDEKASSPEAATTGATEKK